MAKYLYLASCALAVLLLVAFRPAAFGQDLSSFKGQRPLAFSGSFQAGTSFYGAQGIAGRRSPFAWTVSGSANVSIYGISIPFSATFSDRNLSYNYPVYQRFGLSPSYKWIRLHAGYRNMSFSQYSLNGLPFKGVGLELTPGKLRFAAMYGQLETQGFQPTPELTGTFDWVDLHRRKAFGGKIGFGSSSNYFDLHFFKAYDDPNTGNLDTLRKYLITPGANVILGGAFRFTFFRRLVWDTNWAGSAYTENTDAPAFDNLSSDVDFLAQQRLLPVNISSRYYLAGDSRLALNFQNFSLGLKYQYVDPNYRSMGMYYIVNDLENYTADMAFNLMKGKLRLSGQYGLQRTNLRKYEAVTNFRTIGSAALQLNAGKNFSLSASYSNFSYDQRAGIVELNDSLRIANVSSSGNFSPRLSFGKGKLRHTLFVSAQYSEFQDLNLLRQLTGNTTYFNVNPGYTANAKEKAWTLTLGAHYYRTENPSLNNTRVGWNAGFTKALLNKKLQLRFNHHTALSRVDGADDGFIINNSAAFSYKITPRQGITLSTQYLMRATKIQTAFSEWRGSLNYSINFQK